MTVQAIEADGFPISARVESLVSGDSPAAVAKSIGLGVIGFGDVFERLRPDIVLLLGDRYEVFASAQAALVAKLPIAHIAGGDVTEGAYDEAFRHSISKMAHLHFVTNAAAAARLKQLGEDPQFIFNVGSPGLDTVRRVNLLSREALQQTLDFTLRKHNLLVTFHPATLEAGASPPQLSQLLSALDSLGPDFGIVFTKANADTEGRTFNRLLEHFVVGRPNCRLFDSLGQQLYLSLMHHTDVVVGNSSSGLYEAPTMRKAAVNIGNRQKGRLRASSVLDCAPESNAIKQSILAALALDCSQVESPYGDGRSADRIVVTLKSIPEPRDLIQKRFVDA
jgi:UDP-N-acetylglucosamine 2-epimerase (non-hydrolysing)/GDP/UDP-N,N'-diacetylbacillosamine 2-epimerase (hydrolysing)